ncbi:MAG: hypothetical protein JWN51_3610 [Phycisphaerales bacterium]|nr:hypothetical protein [Phycisphaerales bacterium]
MVSPQNPTNPEATIAGRSDRGFVTERVVGQPLPGVETGYAAVSPPAHYYFWGSVLAGTVTAMAIGFLSLALMFGCRVGTYQNGAISFGLGAGIWIVVTSALAYYVGGMVASSFSDPARMGWLRGLTVWGLSVPLFFLMTAIIAGGFGLAYGSTTSRTAEQVVTNTQVATLQHGDLFVNFGGAWTVFFALAVGLFCALVGGSTGSRNVDRMMTNLPGTGTSGASPTR